MAFDMAQLDCPGQVLLWKYFLDETLDNMQMTPSIILSDGRGPLI